MISTSQKNEKIYIWYGFLTLLAYAFSLLKIKIIALAFLAASGVSLFCILFFSEIGLLAVCAALSIPLIIFSGRHISWDVESFEIQGYFDWINNTRGAYWDYSKLPTMLYGTTFTSGSLIRRGFYGLTLVALAASITPFISVRKTKPHWGIYLCLAFVFTNTLSGLWDYGKGDILATSYLLIAYYFAITLSEEGHSEKPIRLLGFILFSCLSMASKMYAIFYIAPLALALITEEFNNLTKIIRSRHITALIIISITIGGSTYAYNIIHYGELIDTSIIALQSGLAIKDHIQDLIKSAFLLPINTNAAIIMAAIYLSAKGVYKNRKKTIHKSVFISLFIGIIFTPLTLIHGLDFSYNFRLISFPIILVIIFHDGFN